MLCASRLRGCMRARTDRFVLLEPPEDDSGWAKVLPLAADYDANEEAKASNYDAKLVRDATGFAIGGVPPFGHAAQLSCWVDQNIYRYEIAWGAAGTPDTVFAIETADLRRLSGGQVAEFTN